MAQNISQQQDIDDGDKEAAYGGQHFSEDRRSGEQRLSFDNRLSPHRAVSSPDYMWSMHKIPERTVDTIMKTYIIYHSSMKKVAEKVRLLHKDQVEIISPTWESFQDGWPNISFTPQEVNAITARNVEQVVYLGSFHSPANLFEQAAVVHALPKFRVKNFRIIVPWFATGTMERVEYLGEIATARTLANILDRTPFCATGPATITIYDIHALQSQFYFSDNVLIELKSAIFLLRQRLLSLPDVDEVSIAFPDDGAQKRFKRKFPEYPDIVCKKTRSGDKRVVSVHDGEPKGRHVVIVDDMVQSGGTLLECASALRAAGATKISCYVTHAIFPNESWRKFVKAHEEGLISHFWITDTLPTVSETEGVEPFEILSIAPLLGHMLTADSSQRGSQCL
eukprot:GEMP01029177.1.p1 GENE.GEMP01029177.1~~GEMP01029177.1.p1  ORF type:complete len:394 (+),score=76.17 GEMP01029177.1:118-1299(+)